VVSPSAENPGTLAPERFTIYWPLPTSHYTGPTEHQRPPHRNHHLLDAILYDESVIEQSAVRKISSGAMG